MHPYLKRDIKQTAAEIIAKTPEGLILLTAMETWLEHTTTSMDVRTITAILQLIMANAPDDHDGALHAIRTTLANKGR